MNCEKVRKTLSAFLDRNLGRGVFDSISRHLAHCRDCSTYAQELTELRSALRVLPARTPPSRLITELQVLASRERVRQLSRGTLTALVHFWIGEMRWLFENLMRPIAIPFAGGLVSAVFLFAMLVPTLQLHHISGALDVPSGLFTQSEAAVDISPPFSFIPDDVVVQLTIDERGSVVDCSIPNGVNSKLRNDIANMILFTKFQPATEYGVPIGGKMLVSFRRIVVKG
jgi:hypothetical protein